VSEELVSALRLAREEIEDVLTRWLVDTLAGVCETADDAANRMPPLVFRAVETAGIRASSTAKGRLSLC
jgi:hypothetical protein